MATRTRGGGGTRHLNSPSPTPYDRLLWVLVSPLIPIHVALTLGTGPPPRMAPSSRVSHAPEPTPITGPRPGQESNAALAAGAVTVAAFGVRLAVGMLFGRQLPALIFVGVVTGVLLAGATVAMDDWTAAIAVAKPLGTGRYSNRSFAAIFESRWDGRLLSYSVATALQPGPTFPLGQSATMPGCNRTSQRSSCLPEGRSPQAVVLRRTLLAAAAGAFTVLALIIVERRRTARRLSTCPGPYRRDRSQSNIAPG